MAPAVAGSVEINYVTGLPKERFDSPVMRPNHIYPASSDRLCLFFEQAVRVDTEQEAWGDRTYYAVPLRFMELSTKGVPYRSMGVGTLTEEEASQLSSALWAAGCRAQFHGQLGPVVMLSVFRSIGD